MELSRHALGRTGLMVTPLCVGTSALGSMPQLYGYAVDDERAAATLAAAFAGPINFLDTSNGYADGESERRIGEAIARAGGLPPGFVLATKIDPGLDGERVDFSGARCRASVAESCERLGLDHLELLYLHDPERISFEEATAAGGALETMLELQRAGVVGHLGVAGGPIEMLERFVETGEVSVVITHNRWTLLDRSALSLLERCEAAGVAVVNGAPFGGGMLAKGPLAHPRYAYRETPDAVREAAAEMERACARHSIPLAAAALQFSLREPRIASTIVGITRPERIAQTLEHAALDIPEELWDELEALVPPSGLWLR